MKRNFIYWVRASLYMIFLLVLLSNCHNQPEPDKVSTTLDRFAYVNFVVDGDTIKVDTGEFIRYLGINTPERDMCYYAEARDFNKQLVQNQRVYLDICEETPTDKYGRTLAQVYVGDVLVNAELMKGGFARTLRIPPCTQMADAYKKYEIEARQAKRGMWGECY